MKLSGNNHKYDRIINLPHHTSLKHPQMALSERAAQFSPFAALTGYDAAIRETARLTEGRMDLDEYERAALDDRIQILKMHLQEKPKVEILYFHPDERKEGGEYLSVTGEIKRVDDNKRCLVMMDGMQIPFEDVLQIDGELFDPFVEL